MPEWNLLETIVWVYFAFFVVVIISMTVGWLLNPVYEVWGQPEDPPVKAGNFVARPSCPDCGCEKMYEGPRGGLSVNVMCAKCETWFNYLPPPFNRLDRIDKPKGMRP